MSAVTIMKQPNVFKVPTVKAKPDSMEALASQYKKLQQQIKDLEAQLDATKSELVDGMKQLDVDELIAGDNIIRYKKIESNRFDSTAFKKSHPELHSEFVKPSMSTRFTVS